MWWVPLVIEQSFTKPSVLSTGKNADLYQNLYFLPSVTLPPNNPIVSHTTGCENFFEFIS